LDFTFSQTYTDVTHHQQQPDIHNTMSTNKTFDTLTEDLIEILASYLEPLDMVHLGATCKHLQKSINRPEIWEQ
jgi:hypothetical protein